MRRSPNGLAVLLGRLTDSKDRETYAALISYVDSLPPGDELFRLVELLGLLSLIGQRLPDALGEHLAELRDQTKAASDYHTRVDARLASLPQEIAAGVDADAVAKSMSEAFRQQLAASGLQDTAALLKAATGTVKAIAIDITSSLEPVASSFRGVAISLAREIERLIAAARKVQEHNDRLIVQQRANRWVLLALAALVLLLVGGVCGILVEHRQRENSL